MGGMQRADSQEIAFNCLNARGFADGNRVLNDQIKEIIDSFVTWIEFFLSFIYFVVW